MLNIQTRIGPNSIDGIGLFAAEFIPAGAEIWRFTPGFDLDVEAASLGLLPDLQRRVLLHYGYIDRSSKRFILCCDNARFMNHSAGPNIASSRDSDSYGVDRAIRDIQPGEELTIDYSSFEDSLALY